MALNQSGTHGTPLGVVIEVQEPTSSNDAKSTMSSKKSSPKKEDSMFQNSNSNVPTIEISDVKDSQEIVKAEEPIPSYKADVKNIDIDIQSLKERFDTPLPSTPLPSRTVRLDTPSKLSDRNDSPVNTKLLERVQTPAPSKFFDKISLNEEGRSHSRKSSLIIPNRKSVPDEIYEEKIEVSLFEHPDEENENHKRNNDEDDGNETGSSISGSEIISHNGTETTRSSRSRSSYSAASLSRTSSEMENSESESLCQCGDSQHHHHHGHRHHNHSDNHKEARVNHKRHRRDSSSKANGVSRRTSLQALELFRSHVTTPQSDSESIVLETEQYVRQMEKRRGQLITKIDTTPGDRLRRKVGYEIERRLVRAMQGKSLKKSKKKRSLTDGSSDHGHGKVKRYFSLNGLTISSTEKKKLQRRNRTYMRRINGRRKHRFCIKCITSSFRALFIAFNRQVLFASSKIGLYNSTPGKPNQYDNTPTTDGGTQAATPSNLEQDVDLRTPTPKMLLDVKDGTLRWPVYQYGGPTGSGMLISTGKLMVPVVENQEKPPPLGRENFSLGEQIEIAYKQQPGSLLESSLDDRRKLVGWLKVRDQNKKKIFTQIIDNSPEGPFRKVPWHGGNMHVLKF